MALEVIYIDFMFWEHRAVLPADGHRDRVWVRVQEEGKHRERAWGLPSPPLPVYYKNWQTEIRKELKAQREVFLLLPRCRKSCERDCKVITRDGHQYNETGEVTTMIDYQNTLIAWLQNISHRSKSSKNGSMVMSLNMQEPFWPNHYLVHKYGSFFSSTK